MIGTDKEIIYRLPANMDKYTKNLGVPAHINQTKNTWQACKVCRGQRCIVVRSRTLGTLTYKTCLNCKGEGVRYNEL